MHEMEIINDEIGTLTESLELPPITEEETTDNTRQGCPDTEAEMINHLLFHKSIIREPNEKVIDVDTYVGILKELDQGMHVVLDSPVDRAVAIAFQLVIDERFDPWNLDLVEFTKLYLKKIRKEEEVNFIIAGRLVLMAWSILKSQSDRVLVDADKVDEPEEFYLDDWDPVDFYDQEETTSFSDIILDGAPPLTEAVRSNDVRGVTLMSLVEAFEEAREEIALNERIKKFAKTQVVKPVVISENLHQESLQEDISITWQRICKFNGSPIPISDLWNSTDTFDKVTVFVSTLFLAKMNKVKLSQRKLPYGQIMVKNIEGVEMQPEVEVKIDAEQPVPEEIQRDFVTAHIDSLAVV